MTALLTRAAFRFLVILALVFGTLRDTSAQAIVPLSDDPLFSPTALAMDGNEHLIIADGGNARIEQLSLRTGSVATMLSMKSQTLSSGVPLPELVVQPSVDRSGNLYYLTSKNKVFDPAASGYKPASFNMAAQTLGFSLMMLSRTGSVRTILSAPTAATMFSMVPQMGGGPAASRVSSQAAVPGSPQAYMELLSKVHAIFGYSLEPSGDVLVSDGLMHRILRYSMQSRQFFAVAGKPSMPTDTTDPDGAPATDAHLGVPSAVTTDSRGDIFFVENRLVDGGGSFSLRKIDARSGKVSTIIGQDHGVAGSQPTPIPMAIQNGGCVVLGGALAALSQNAALTAVGDTVLVAGSFGVAEVDGVTGSVTVPWAIAPAAAGTQQTKCPQGIQVSAATMDAAGNLFVAQAGAGPLRSGAGSVFEIDQRTHVARVIAGAPLM